MLYSKDGEKLYKNWCREATKVSTRNYAGCSKVISLLCLLSSSYAWMKLSAKGYG